MTALPHSMHDAAIVREHQDGEARIVAEWSYVAPEPFTPPPCNVCQGPATVHVRCDAAHCRTPRCDAHGETLINSLTAKGYTVAVTPYRNADAKIALATAFVAEAVTRKPYSVEQADARAVCGNCDESCFEPKPCHECKDGMLLCSECQLECDGCGEHFCLDHMANSRFCRGCDHAEKVSSGAAMAEYRQFGRDDE